MGVPGVSGRHVEDPVYFLPEPDPGEVEFFRALRSRPPGYLNGATARRRIRWSCSVMAAPICLFAEVVDQLFRGGDSSK